MVSVTTRGDMFASEADEGLLVLLTIDHDDLAEPIRVVANNENVTSNGNEFIAYPFEIILPTSSPDAPPRAQLTIDNVTREIAQTIRQISSAPTVLIEVVRTDDFDSIEFSFPQLNLKNVRWDAGQVSGDLVSEDLQLEPYPADTFVPSNFPGLF